MTHGGKILLVSALALLAVPVLAQDSLPPTTGFPLDLSRSAPFRTEFEMLARFGDSAHVTGRRVVEMAPATYADAPVWLIIERRMGAVAAVESLYVSQGMQPLRWSGALGPASLAMVFARDSIFGATSGPGGRQSVVVAGAPTMIVSLAMLEALLPLLPLTEYWRDSVSAVVVDQSTTRIVPSELAVLGSDDRSDAWIVALRATGQTLILWVNRQSGRIIRSQQPLPLHTAPLLEYRAVESSPP
ncbi:MAG TPA: hypothetical protein VEB19_03810 [Gemmatimonadaceae bacterium]|nr:hypothetical protein [Gemmatimonadaceae bacterium]